MIKIERIEFDVITDVIESVRADVGWLASRPLLHLNTADGNDEKKGGLVTGWLYDVDTGRVRSNMVHSD